MAKIEIKDRAFWLKKVRSEIEKIMSERAARDRTVKAAWDKYVSGMSRWRRILFGPHPTVTEPTFEFLLYECHYASYPSEYASRDLNKLRNLERILISENTGVIFFTDDDVRSAS